MAEFYSATVRLFDRFCGPVLLRDSHFAAFGISELETDVMVEHSPEPEPDISLGESRALIVCGPKIDAAFSWALLAAPCSAKFAVLRPSVMVLTGHELETYADLARETIRHEKRWLRALEAEKRRRRRAADPQRNHLGNEVTI